MNNPIIQEVRDIREALAAKFDFDLHRIIVDAIARQSQMETVNRQTSKYKARFPMDKAEMNGEALTTSK